MIGYRSTHILMIDNPNESEMFQRTFVVVWSSNKKQTDLTSQLVLSENVRVFWNNKKMITTWQFYETIGQNLMNKK